MANMFFTDTYGRGIEDYARYNLPKPSPFLRSPSNLDSPNGDGEGLGSIAQITQLVNEINQAAQKKANAGRIPNEPALENQSSANIGNALAGVIDPSVTRNLAQASAERGVMTGSPQGPNSNADYLRALGLTTLDLHNRGQDWLNSATARNPAAPIYRAENQVLTAEQVQQAILAREQMANNLRIAQMHYANPGRGSFGGGGGARATTSAPRVGGSNYAELFPGGGGGWNFPPGYDSIPRGGTQSGTTDEDFLNYWFPVEEESSGPTDQEFVDYWFPTDE